MNSLGLLRVAAEAELLRIRILLKRQAWRGAYGGIAGVFGLSVLAVANVLVWQLLRLAFGPIETTAILLGINLALMAIFGWLAARSTRVWRNAKPCGCARMPSAVLAIHCS